MRHAPSSYLKAAVLSVGCLLWPAVSGADGVAAVDSEPLYQPGDRFDRSLQRLDEITEGQGQAALVKLVLAEKKAERKAKKKNKTRS